MEIIAKDSLAIQQVLQPAIFDPNILPQKFTRMGDLSLEECYNSRQEKCPIVLQFALQGIDPQPTPNQTFGNQEKVATNEFTFPWLRHESISPNASWTITLDSALTATYRTIRPTLLQGVT